MKKYFSIITLLIVALFICSSGYCQPTGALKGYYPASGTFKVLTVDTPTADVPAWPFSYPTGTALGFYPASSTYHPLIVDGDGKLAVDAGVLWEADPSGGIKPINDEVVNLTGGGIASYFDFDTTAGTPAYSAGRVFYDALEGVLGFMPIFDGPILQIGQETWIWAYNNTGSQINDGQLIYIDSAIAGTVPLAKLAQANSVTTCDVIGMATMDVANASYGFFATYGKVNGLDTSGFSVGDDMFLSATTPGSMSTTIPAAPNCVVKIGSINTSDATTGSILFRPSTSGALFRAQFADDIDVAGNVNASGSLIVDDIGTTKIGLGISEDYGIDGLPVALAESLASTWYVAEDTTESEIRSLAYLGNGIALAGSSVSGIIYKSTDYGDTWAVASDTAETHILSMSYLGNGIALAGSLPSGIIYKSADYGGTWAVASDTAEEYIFSMTCCGNGIALAGSYPSGIIYKSTDYGDTWAVASDTTETHILSMSYLGNGVALAGSVPSGIIYKSSDYGDTWAVASDTTSGSIGAFAHMGNGVALAGSQPSGIIYKSTDYGDTWAVVSVTGETEIVALANLGNGVALAGSQPSGIIYKSSDYGDTWAVASDTAETSIPSLLYLGNGVALAGTSSGGIIYKSSDYGAGGW